MTALKKIKLLFSALLIFSLLGACTQEVAQTDAPPKIENTMKSVSIMQDSVPIDLEELRVAFNGMNLAIDSIGYPDAGYELWVMNGGNDSLGYRFMVEGHWPDQEGYDLIHGHDLYKQASEKVGKDYWEKLTRVSYHRFSRAN